MMHHDTPAKAQAARELREERARAFWQAQINEGRARLAENAARTNKPAPPREDPEPPAAPQAPPPPIPLHEISAEPAADVIASRRCRPSRGHGIFRHSRRHSHSRCYRRRVARRSPVLGRPAGQRSCRLAGRAGPGPGSERQRGAGSDRHLVAEWRCRNPFLPATPSIGEIAWGCSSIEPNPYRVKLRIGFAHIACIDMSKREHTAVRAIPSLIVALTGVSREMLSASARLLLATRRNSCGPGNNLWVRRCALFGVTPRHS